jgi:3-oxoacyl-[acyl-carrier-protein] synthase II
MEERVAITGLGIISAAGLGRGQLQEALEAGVPRFSDEEVAPGVTKRVGRVGELTPTSIRLQSSKASQIDAISRYAVEACAQALKEAGIELDEEARDRTGVLLGTAFGCFESNVLFDQYHRSEDGRLMGVSPLLFKSTVANAAAGWASILLKLRGVNATFTSGRLAGAEAIAHAFELVREGATDLIFAGGLDRVLPMNLLLDPVEEGVAAEGAGIVALESMSRAVARGARIYGRLQGYTRRLMRDGDEAGFIGWSIERLGIRKHHIGAVVVSRSDEAAVEAIRAALPEKAGIAPAVWPLKQLMGECYAAWGGLALAAACLKLETLSSSAPTVLVVVTEPGQEAICLALRRAHDLLRQPPQG